MDNECVVGARLRKLPAALKKQVLDPDAYGPLEGSQSRRVGEWEHKGRRLIVVWCPERGAQGRTRAPQSGGALARQARAQRQSEGACSPIMA